MKIVFLVLLLLAILVVILIVHNLYKRKPKKPLRQGDYVMLKNRYKKDYPRVPTTHALVVEKLSGEQAVVVFMDIKNQILKETVPLYVLCKAS